ncbi:uncharacterized protein N7473_011671 [Penicillium subrubescens]|uniref:uncharacterized protein n=1 Tax=Penicillium subrubescens TaxID=1316194 RepID=UPI0025455EF5|nr:uncharacterized protein N7473_011671 [Penicillium subrubescens]KAJ5880618.1 hypothetical protein N7473_011671 [Penicillium subrubescens]
MFLCSLLTVCLIWVCFVPAVRAEHDGTTHPLITVVNGTYYGLHNSQYNQDIFLDMSVAQQPVGDLRFHVPLPLNTSWSLPRNATEYSPACRGYNQKNGASEACLTLNVVRPRGFSPKKNSRLLSGFMAEGLPPALHQTHDITCLKSSINQSKSESL